MADSRYFHEKADEMLRMAAASLSALERHSYMRIAAAWRELATAAEAQSGSSLGGQIIPPDLLNPLGKRER